MKVKTVTKRNQLKVEIRLSGSEQLDDEKLMFLESVYLPGLFKLEQIGEGKLSYVGSPGVSLSQRLKKTVTERQFYIFVEQISVTTERLMNNGLSVQQLILNPDYIFVDEVSSELLFLYVPVGDGIHLSDPLSFLTSLVYQIQPDPSENTDYVAMFAHFVKQMSSYSPKRIENYIERKDRQVVQLYRVYLEDKKKLYEPGQDIKTTPMNNRDAAALLNEPTEGKMSVNPKTADNLHENGADKLENPALERLSAGELITIDRPVFRFGTDSGSVDYAIEDNPAISRNHADLIVRQSHYYVKDLNSKNRTYINSRMIPGQTEIEIFDGDRIKMADEEFIFHGNPIIQRPKLVTAEGGDDDSRNQ